MSLWVCVQHHPSRRDLLPELLARLGGQAEVITDPDPDHPVASPLRTYLECLRRAPLEASTILVVQDDTWPCDDFLPRAQAFVDAHPDCLIPFCVTRQGSPGNAVMRALRRDLPEVEIPMGWVPTIALAWPHAAAQAFLAYSSRWDPAYTRGDDGPVGTWRREARWRAVAPVPSLIEHPDRVRSIFRSKEGAAGRNKARVAVRFAS